MSHTCTCQTGERLLALIPGQIREESADFLDVVRELGWTDRSDLGVVLVHIGPSRRFQSAQQVSDVLRTVLEAEQFRFMRAAWLDATTPLEEQASTLLTASALSEFTNVEDTELWHILETGSLETLFQPVFRLPNLSPYGFECLMRGRNADGELVSPGKLIAQSRQLNLTFMLDRVCRETHIHNAAQQAIPDDLHVMINFMPNAVYEPQFCLRTTLAALEHTELQRDQIIFEVVETESITEQAHLKNVLEYYRNQQVKVALDDLGTGYSGLDWLGEFKPDLIKIDRNIVNKAVSSDMHFDIAEAILKLGRSHDILVLAEGVETRDEFEQMRDLGVDLVQGFLLGRPNPTPVTQAHLD
ncbi:MAG: EAL domain-containing protein [Candidatus Bipolaricaulia bacterium]